MIKSKLIIGLGGFAVLAAAIAYHYQATTRLERQISALERDKADALRRLDASEANYRQVSTALDVMTAAWQVAIQDAKAQAERADQTAKELEALANTPLEPVELEGLNEWVSDLFRF